MKNRSAHGAIDAQGHATQGPPAAGRDGHVAAAAGTALPSGLMALGSDPALFDRGGHKVACAEVENVLLLHDEVIRATVIGRPDPVPNTLCCAVVAHAGCGVLYPAIRCRGWRAPDVRKAANPI